MTTVFVLLAILSQSADAALTCRALSSGKNHESNSIYGPNATCSRIVGIKAAGLGAAALLPHKRLGFGAMAVGGAVGMTVTWRFSK